MQDLFGTDGIRARVGEGVLATTGLRRLAGAIGSYLREHSQRAPARVLIGRDTRTSGAAIAGELAGELAGSGIEVTLAGVMPTPALSLLVPRQQFDLGIVISASHNPPEFNGVKLLAASGHKLGVAVELDISRRFHEEAEVEGRPAGQPEECGDFQDRYCEALLEPGFDLSGLRIVLDCAEGAASGIAPRVFRAAGAEVESIFDAGDGARINEGCGSLHTETLAGRVVDSGADLGVAFDGDADRAILVDDQGGRVDGDDMMALLAFGLQECGELTGGRIVATVMSNGGMEDYLRANGIGLLRMPVGDREVAAGLAREGLVLGGEQSGHIIFPREAATGDGLRTGLHMARLVRERGQPLSALRATIPRYPQTLLAVDVSHKPPLEEQPAVIQAQAEARAVLRDRGRILLRYSGTEPIARVLVEGPDATENRRLAGRLADSIRVSLG